MYGVIFVNKFNLNLIWLFLGCYFCFKRSIKIVDYINSLIIMVNGYKVDY